MADRSTSCCAGRADPTGDRGARTSPVGSRPCLDTTGALPTCLPGRHDRRRHRRELRDRLVHRPRAGPARRRRDAGRPHARRRARTAAARIREQVARVRRTGGRLDLGSLDSVQEFAEDWQGPLGLLVNNAGLMAPPRYQQTADGFELQFGTNHLGHFALTGLLLPALQAAPAGRVVTVSSVAHHQGRATSSTATRRRLQPVGGPTATPSWPTCCSPSSCSAGRRWRQPGDRDRRAPRASPRPTWSPASRGWARSRGSSSWRRWSCRVLFQSARAGRGADAVRRHRGRPRLLHRPAVAAGDPRPRRTGQVSRLARDETLAGTLWQVSEDLTGVRFDWDAQVAG